jgi:hypothetical protein
MQTPSERSGMKRTGGCFCGAVRYEITGKPKLAVSCHCRDCQYASGGAPAHALILLREHVRITKGAPKEHWSLSAKGNRIARLFCEHCGTPLFARNEAHPEFLPVKIGSLDDPAAFRPQANIWVCSAQPWHDLDPAIPRFDRDPELGISALVELARSSLVRLVRRAGMPRRRRSGPAVPDPSRY